MVFISVLIYVASILAYLLSSLVIGFKWWVILIILIADLFVPNIVKKIGEAVLIVWGYVVAMSSDNVTVLIIIFYIYSVIWVITTILDIYSGHFKDTLLY